MGYSDQDSNYSGKKLAFLFVPFSIAIVLKYTPVKDWVFGPSTSPASIEAEVLSDPNTGFVAKTFKSKFPSEFAKLVDLAADSRKAGDSEDIVKNKTSSFLSNFISERLATIDTASVQTILSNARAHYSLTVSLRKADKVMCAEFGNTGLSPASLAKLTDEQYKLLGESSEAMFTIIADGEANKVVKTPRQITPEILSSFNRKMSENGLTPQLAGALEQQKSISPANANDLCEASYIVTKSIIDLPSEQGAAVMGQALKMKYSARP